MSTNMSVAADMRRTTQRADGTQTSTARTSLPFILGLLDELTCDLDLPPIDARTVLKDLGLESISLVYLLAELQLEFDLRDALFRYLRSTAGKVKDMTVAELAAVVEEIIEMARDEQS